MTARETKDIEDILLAVPVALTSLTGPSAVEMAKRARANSAGAMMNMVRAGAETGALFKSRIEEFASDPSPDVRAEIAMRLGYLWRHDREVL